MDPITLIVAALAAGAAAGLKPTAEAAIKDAYAGLRRLLTDRYRRVDVGPLEQRPSSEAKRASLEEDLRDTEADQDTELLIKAKALLDLVAERDPDAVTTVGVDLEDLQAAFVDIERIRSDGTGVRGRGWDVDGGVRITDVEARGRRDDIGDQPDPS